MKLSILLLSLFVPLLILTGAQSKPDANLDENDIVGTYCLCKQEIRGSVIANPLGPIIHFNKSRPSYISVKHESVPFGWALKYDVLYIRNESGKAVDFTGDFKVTVKPHPKGKELILTDEKRRIKYYLTPSKYTPPPKK